MDPWPPGIGPDPDTIDRLCHLVLDLVCDFGDDLTPDPMVDGAYYLPERRYVSPGVPPWDQCGQVSVHAETVWGHAGPINQPVAEQYPPASGWAMRAVQLQVTIVRCLTAWDDSESRLDPEQLPAVSIDEADARLTNADPQVVLSALIKAATQDGALPLEDGAFAFGAAQSIVAGTQVAQVISVTFDLATMGLFLSEVS